MLLPALALFCLALALAIEAVVQSMRITSLERHLAIIQRDLIETRSLVEHECRQLRRAELRLDALEGHRDLSIPPEL